MTVNHLQQRLSNHGLSFLGLAVLLALCGCKSSNPDAGRSSDPLVSGARIPAQNMPIPDRGGLGAKDPLLTPTAKPADKNGVGYGADDPNRFKGTFINGPSSTPAALAGNLKDGEELKIDGNENRVPLQPVSGVLPPRPADQNPALDSLYHDLENYGCMSTDRSLTQENGQYVFRATVKRAGVNGPKLQCTETGKTAEEAIKKVLDDVAEQK